MTKEKSNHHGTEAPTPSHEQEALLQWFKKVRFRKAFLGGVDETDVWRKLEELNRLYEASIAAERTRYDALLEAYAQSATAEMNEYRKTLADERQRYEELKQAYIALKTRYGKRDGDE